MVDNLPAEISLDIFSRLPAHTVLECKRVCKTWRNHLLLDKAIFAAMHLQHIHHHHDRKVFNNGVVSEVSSTQGLILINRSKNNENMLYGEYEDDIINTNQTEPSIQNKLRLINHSLPTRAISTCLVGSCNGLICLAELIEIIKDDDDYRFIDPIHIYNPITREYLYLGGYNENDEYSDVCVHRIYSGFGYSAQTNEYKVVRIIYRSVCINGVESCRGDIQVYTLGGGSGWRNIGVITSWFFTPKVFGVFFNGAIYWLDWNKRDVRVFNLSDETFHVLPEPVPVSKRFCQCNSILGSLGEWLCVIGWETGKLFNIWAYKKTSSVKSSIAAAADNKDESWSWCKEFSITLENSNVTSYIPFALTKSGSVLLLHYETSNPCDTLQAIPHTNSFVSLKDLGETTCEETN